VRELEMEPADGVPPERIAIGIDIGGSGIKASAVDVGTGSLVGVRLRVATPDPSTPEACIASIARLVKRIVKATPAASLGPIGIGVPTVVVDGVTRTAANIDPGWTDFPADAAFETALKRPVHVVNDADAAGVAEMRFGAGAGHGGSVLVLTLGTGTGSALFIDGRLVPNTELGHMEIRGKPAEWRSAANARLRRGLSWKAWAADLDEHLLAIDRILTPSLIILGGGVSKRADRFLERLTVPVPVIPAALRNDAGMVGAAMLALEAIPTSGERATDDAGAVATDARADVEADELTADAGPGIEPPAPLPDPDLPGEATTPAS
jgi:polyphosphate glucokinase